MYMGKWTRRFNGHAGSLGSAGNLGFNFGHIKSRGEKQEGELEVKEGQGDEERERERKRESAAEFVKSPRIYIRNDIDR